MVRMAPRLTFGTATADWQRRIDVDRLRRERAERARAVMRARGIPALPAARADNTRYLTGLRGPEFAPQLWYVLFLAEGEPVVFHHAGWLADYPAEAPWIREWRLARAWLPGAGPDACDAEAALFATGIADQLAARGLRGEPLAVAGFDARAQRALAGAGLKTVDGASLMLEATRTKTVDEIACPQAGLRDHRRGVGGRTPRPASGRARRRYVAGGWSASRPRFRSRRWPTCVSRLSASQWCGACLTGCRTSRRRPGAGSA